MSDWHWKDPSGYRVESELQSTRVATGRPIKGLVK